MKKIQVKDPPPIVTWIGTIIGILGTPLVTVISYFINNKILTNIISIIIAVFITAVSVFIFQKLKYKHQTDMNNITRDLEEKREELEAKIRELEEKDKRLIENNNQIDELNNRIKACKKALIGKEKLTPLDYYLIDKDVFDEFKTDLTVSKCCLDVALVKMSENSEKYNLQFEWRLNVINNGSKPVCMARFIYSGEENIDSDLIITAEEVTFEKYSSRTDIKVLGDDRFIEIDFADELAVGQSAVIHIKYVFEKYEFNRMHDSIWLVPDALGFADMDKYCIRFYCDGEVVHKNTKVELKSYRLRGEYKLERKSPIFFKELKNGKGGFEVKSGSREELHDQGYVLEFSNKTK